MKQTLFLDMDGVVADFAAGCEKIVGYRLDEYGVYYPNDDWKKIQKHQRLFRDLPKFPGGDKMVYLAREFRDKLDWNLLFLTAIPHSNDFPWAIIDKIEWAKDYYSDIPVHFGPYSREKYKHCKPNDILVDDRIDNCDEWRKVGGIAVRVDYKKYDQSLDQLKDILDKKLSLKRLQDLGNIKKI